MIDTFAWSDHLAEMTRKWSKLNERAGGDPELSRLCDRLTDSSPLFRRCLIPTRLSSRQHEASRFPTPRTHDQRCGQRERPR